MISDITFYSAPISHRNRVFPLGAPGAQYKITTVEKALCVEDLAMRIQVDWFAGWDRCNLVYMHATSEYYWINQMGTVTNNSKQVTFELVLNPVTSYIQNGSMLKGVWDRLPSNLDVNIRDPAVGGSMAIVKSTPLYAVSYCWVELVLKKRIGYSGERITRYGMFCKAPKSNGILSTEEVDCYRTNGAKNYYTYPSMFTIVNNFSDIFEGGESTDIIMSINASARCPYTYSMAPANSVDVTGIYLNKSSNYPFITPKTFRKYRTLDSLGLNYYYCMYEIDGDSSSDIKMRSDTITITLTDEEIKSGDVSIINGAGSIISTIPNEYFVDNKVDIVMTSSSDFLGIYTDLDINGHKVRLNSSRLPWLGNAWLDYQARTMAYDRSSMELAISSAKDQMHIDLATGASNALVTGILGGALAGGANPLASVTAGLGMSVAQFGLTAASAKGQYNLDTKTARAEQELKQENQKAQLSNFYNVSEGVKSLVDDFYVKYRVTVAMPSGVSDDYYTAFRDEYGYKAQGVRTISIGSGYHKGRLIDIPVNGLKGDLLNNEFIEGLKLIEIGGV